MVQWIDSFGQTKLDTCWSVWWCFLLCFLLLYHRSLCWLRQVRACLKGAKLRGRRCFWVLSLCDSLDSYFAMLGIMLEVSNLCTHAMGKTWSEFDVLTLEAAGFLKFTGVSFFANHLSIAKLLRECLRPRGLETKCSRWTDHRAD